MYCETTEAFFTQNEKSVHTETSDPRITSPLKTKQLSPKLTESYVNFLHRDMIKLHKLVHFKPATEKVVKGFWYFWYYSKLKYLGSYINTQLPIFPYASLIFQNFGITEKTLKKLDSRTWYIPCHIWFKVFKNGPNEFFLKAVFHKFHLVHS